MNRTHAHGFLFVFAKTIVLTQGSKCGAYTALAYPQSHNNNIEAFE